jgi:hypothetical protein
MVCRLPRTTVVTSLPQFFPRSLAVPYGPSGKEERSVRGLGRNCFRQPTFFFLLANKIHGLDSEGLPTPGYVIHSGDFIGQSLFREFAVFGCAFFGQTCS